MDTTHHLQPPYSGHLAVKHLSWATGHRRIETLHRCRKYLRHIGINVLNWELKKPRKR